jgi:hypothetical protein
MISAAKPKCDDQFQSLLDTVERLRRDKFQQLDAGLVREVLQLHSDGAASDGDLTRGVEKALESHLTKEG